MRHHSGDDGKSVAYFGVWRRCGGAKLENIQKIALNLDIGLKSHSVDRVWESARPHVVSEQGHWFITFGQNALKLRVKGTAGVEEYF